MLVRIDTISSSQWHEQKKHFRVQGSAAKVGMKIGDILSEDPDHPDYNLRTVTLTIMEDPEVL